MTHFHEIIFIPESVLSTLLSISGILGKSSVLFSIPLPPTPKGSQNLRVGSMFTPTPCLRVYPCSPSTFLRSHCFSFTKLASLCPSASHTLSNPSPGSINVLVYIYPKIIMISSCTCNWKDQCFTKPTLYAWYMCRERDAQTKPPCTKKKKIFLIGSFLDVI